MLSKLCIHPPTQCLFLHFLFFLYRLLRFLKTVFTISFSPCHASSAGCRIWRLRARNTTTCCSVSLISHVALSQKVVPCCFHLHEWTKFLIIHFLIFFRWRSSTPTLFPWDRNAKKYNSFPLKKKSLFAFMFLCDILFLFCPSLCHLFLILYLFFLLNSHMALKQLHLLLLHRGSLLSTLLLPATAQRSIRAASKPL